MPDIMNEIAAIQVATTGSEIRSAVADALIALNDYLPSDYSGSYIITPSTSSVTVPVSGYTMSDNLVVEAFPVSYYSGSYTVEPSTSSQILSVSGFMMSNDLIINSASSGGDSGDFVAMINGTISGILENSTIALIRDHAFYGCSKLTGVSFQSCSSIGNMAFYGCESLLNAIFPLCQYIGNAAFSKCYSLSIASFPACQNIESYAFYNCSALQSLYFLGSSVPALSSPNVFYNTPISSSAIIGQFGSIYVLESMVASFKSATNWSNYSDRITAYTE